MKYAIGGLLLVLLFGGRALATRKLYAWRDRSGRFGSK
jgi:hypothetical protein